MDKGQDKRYKDICNWFVQQISALKQISQHEIKAEFPFSRYGLDSKELVSLSGELEALVNRSVDPTLFWDYPSIQAVARHFAFGGEDGHAARYDCGAGTRLLSSAWAADFPNRAASTNIGIISAAERTASRRCPGCARHGSRRTVCTVPVSLKKSICSIMKPSTYLPARRSRCIRSSACCCKWYGRRSRMRD